MKQDDRWTTSYSDAPMVQQGISNNTLPIVDHSDSLCIKHLIFYHLRILSVIECGLARTWTLQMVCEVVQYQDGWRGQTLYYLKAWSGQRKQILESICGGKQNSVIVWHAPLSA